MLSTDSSSSALSDLTHLSMEANALPTDAFRRLLPALIKVVTTTQENEGPLTPQAKQALLQAVSSLEILGEARVNQARDRRTSSKSMWHSQNDWLRIFQVEI